MARSFHRVLLAGACIAGLLPACGDDSLDRVGNDCGEYWDAVCGKAVDCNAQRDGGPVTSTFCAEERPTFASSCRETAGARIAVASDADVDACLHAVNATECSSTCANALPPAACQKLGATAPGLSVSCDTSSTRTSNGGGPAEMGSGTPPVRTGSGAPPQSDVQRTADACDRLWYAQCARNVDCGVVVNGAPQGEASCAEDRSWIEGCLAGNARLFQAASDASIDACVQATLNVSCEDLCGQHRTVPSECRALGFASSTGVVTCERPSPEIPQ